MRAWLDSARVLVKQLMVRQREANAPELRRALMAAFPAGWGPRAGTPYKAWSKAVAEAVGRTRGRSAVHPDGAPRRHRGGAGRPLHLDLDAGGE